MGSAERIQDQLREMQKVLQAAGCGRAARYIKRLDRAWRSDHAALRAALVNRDLYGAMGSVLDAPVPSRVFILLAQIIEGLRQIGLGFDGDAAMIEELHWFAEPGPDPSEETGD